jgi:L-lactate utilization protein LutB
VPAKSIVYDEVRGNESTHTLQPNRYVEERSRCNSECGKCTQPCSLCVHLVETVRAGRQGSGSLDEDIRIDFSHNVTISKILGKLVVA